MEKVISAKDLRDLGLLGVEYTELDLYDAFMMYLILNSKTTETRVVLKDGNHVFDKSRCFGMDNWF